jgi:hypothetical protein
MNSPKEVVQRILDQLPADVSLEQIQYHIYVCQKIERGLKEVDSGQAVSQATIEARMSKWLKT